MVRRLLLAVLAGTLLAGCGGGADLPAGGPPDEAAYAERELTWVSQDDDEAVLHRGEEEVALPAYVDAVWPTAYGVLVEHRSGPTFDTGSSLALVAGSETTTLPGSPSGAHVSPDGRFAGWVDYSGPRRVGYRLAEVVVVDLATGEEVLRDHDDMGGWFDQDLYGNQWPTFYGFDDAGHAYWETAEEDGEDGRWRRVDLATGDVTVASGDPRAEVVDPLRGRDVVGGDGMTGFASPDGRWCLTDGRTGWLPVTDCASEEQATPDYPAGRVRFAGWTEDPDEFWVLAARRGLEVMIPPDEPDPSRGVLARCTLPSGECVVEQRVRRLGSLVLPGDPAF